MNDTQLLELLALLGGAGAIGPVLVRQFFKYLANRDSAANQRRHIEGLKRITKIYDELNQVIACDSNIARVMVIRSSNSGQIPSPGCRIFIRILHESYRSLSDSIIHSNLWDERQADHHYIELVRKIAQEGYVDLRTDEMPEDAALKSVYVASQTERAKVYRLKLTGTEMIYLSINYRLDTETPPISKAVSDNSVANLKSLFS